MSSSIAGIVAAVATITVLVPSPGWAIGSTPVSVVNPVDIAKAQGIQQPFQSQINCDATGGFGIRCFGAAAVPPGQRWVIEYVSASCLLDNTRQTMSQVYLSTSIGGYAPLHYLAIHDRVGAQGDSGTVINVVQLGQPVRLYADAGTSVRFGMGTSGISQFAGYPYCSVSLSGQAVSVP